MRGPDVFAQLVRGWRAAHPQLCASSNQGIVSDPSQCPFRPQNSQQQALGYGIHEAVWCTAGGDVQFERITPANADWPSFASLSSTRRAQAFAVISCGIQTRLSLSSPLKDNIGGSHGRIRGNSSDASGTNLGRNSRT